MPPLIVRCHSTSSLYLMCALCRIETCQIASSGDGRRRASVRSVRGGFTLIEISIALALLVVVASIAVPIYRNVLKTERLNKAVGAIRADWIRTRAKAMQQGETQVWICQLVEGSFGAANYSTAAAGSISSGSATTANTTNIVSSSTDDASGVAGGGSSMQTLPEGMSISSVLISEADTLVTMSQLSNAGETGSAAVFFYPNGTSSTARITIVNPNNQARTVVLNGLSGTTRVMESQEPSQ